MWVWMLLTEAGASPVVVADPLVRGAPTTVLVRGVAPGREVVVVGSAAGLGPGPCPPPLQGACLSLVPPITELGRALATGAGEAAIHFDVPAGLVVGEVGLQAVVPSLGELSDAVAVPVVDPTLDTWERVVRVGVLDFDPTMPSGQPLHRHYGWNDPRALASALEQDLEQIQPFVDFAVVSWVDLDLFPVKADGFRYDATTYADCWERGVCHAPDQVDYVAILEASRACEAVTAGEIDEVWLFGAPYFGYWESTMAGDGGFWLNSPPVPYPCAERFVIMGFNYERGVESMLHDYGHRLESTMARAVGLWRGRSPDPYTGFRQTEHTAPGDARCGDTHFPPNADHDYEYAEPTPVASACDAYLTWPALDLEGSRRTFGCEAWGCQERGYQKWMLGALPRNAGQSQGWHHNWWRYLFDFDALL